VALLVLVAVLCITIMTRWYVPLTWPGGGFNPPALYRVGLWTALCFAAVFIASYVWRVASEARHSSAALAATQLALAREQKVSAVGAVAAALAHELGTPLGTIAVVARELSREVTPDDPLREDIDLLQSQSDRCREILANLSRRPGEVVDDPLSPTARTALGVLIEEAAAPHRVAGVALHVVARGKAPQPTMPRGPEMLHGLGNLLQNAQQFARAEVVVELDWTPRIVRVTITDDGPGFPPALLPRLGEPYLSARQEDGRGEGHGLGIYIACTLLARTGAALSFANRRKAGGEVAVEWRRQYLEG
jgi:two-component system, sensor histidine kinase RegB